MNGYTYANGQPITGIDPFGLFMGTPLSAGEWFGAVATGAGEGFQHNVIDPIGTAAGLAVYTNVPGTVKLGVGVGAAGYVSIGRSESGAYTVDGGFGDGFGGVLDVSTKSPTHETINGRALSFGAGVESEIHVGPASVDWGVNGSATFANNGNYVIDVKGEAAAAIAGTPFNVGGEAGPTITGNLANDSSVRGDLFGPPEAQASAGFGSMIFVGVHGGYTWGGKKHGCE